MNALFLDTNILLRFITGKPVDQAKRAYDFFSRMTAKKTHHLILADTVVMETVFTLRSFYGLPPDAVESREHPF